MMDTSTLEKKTTPPAVGKEMRAAVYRGKGRLEVETVPVPEIGTGEILVRVHSCGICGTDLKKIEHNLVQPPRIFGHEIAGTVERKGPGVKKFALGDRVALHHHIPCRTCFFCQRRLFSQCEFYRRTGTTAGFEPAGGGFAEYVRVMDWIVEEGAIAIPDDISFEEASFLEPLNTCLKALETAELESGEVVAILGQGPIGLLLLQAALCEGARVVAVDFLERRLEISREFGAELALNPERDDLRSSIARLTDGRGADLVLVATADSRAVNTGLELARRGGRVLLFAQTLPDETIPVQTYRICVEEKKLIGSYSASVVLQEKAASMIFTRRVNTARLVSHRFGLDQLHAGVLLASRPTSDSLKVLIQP
jgi:L-iditol 2-dehydrogenase